MAYNEPYPLLRAISDLVLSNSGPEFLKNPARLTEEFLNKSGSVFSSYKQVQQSRGDFESNLDRNHKLGCKLLLVWNTNGSEAEKERALNAVGVKFDSLWKVAEKSLNNGVDNGACPSVPRVRFGKTEEMVSILTCGGMRQQQRWGPSIQEMSQVEDDCQKNFKEIIRWALALGINHFETARGYGCSELQYGEALRELFESGEVKREEILLQTKVGAKKTKEAFREDVEKSFRLLQVDYVDFFSIHGINRDFHLDWLFNNGADGNCWDVVEEYMADGKIRHIGFSSHGTVDLIERTIKTGKFEYANLHYHYFGSYTASGDGPEGGNLSNIKLLKEMDMGVFIISPFDKGGALYKPSKRLQNLCNPEMEPIEFGAAWLWQHKNLPETGKSPIHTIVCGAARPSDLDDAAMVAFSSLDEVTERAVKTVDSSLQKAFTESFPEGWKETWYKGVPNCYETKTGVNFTNALWCYNLLTAYGMLDFVNNRYVVGINNRKKWNDDLSYDENMKNGDWGYMPGLSIEPEKDYKEELRDVPRENVEMVLAGMRKVHALCELGERKKNKEESNPNDGDDEMAIPEDWEAAFDLRPWTAFPER